MTLFYNTLKVPGNEYQHGKSKKIVCWHLKILIMPSMEGN